jgi:hypothetical protein
MLNSFFILMFGAISKACSHQRDSMTIAIP